MAVFIPKVSENKINGDKWIHKQTQRHIQREREIMRL